MQKGRYYNDLKTGPQTTTIPYGALWFEGDAPDQLSEANEEGADIRLLNGAITRSCAYARLYAIEYRKAGLTPIRPAVTHERSRRGNVETHHIFIRLPRANGELRQYLQTLAAHDPARDSQEEGDDLEQVANDCAAMAESALLFCFDAGFASDAPVEISGSVRSKSVEA